jgi:transketolase
VGITHLHASTLKPFSDPAVIDAIARSTHGVVTVENHLVSGGLGSAVSDLISERNLGRRLVKVGIRDTFTHGGSQPYLFEEYGIGGAAVIDAIEDLTGQPLDVDRDALRDPTVNPLRASVAEGL